MSDHMTTITADELLKRADVCAFRDTALELLRADASPWQLRTALSEAAKAVTLERALRRSDAEDDALLRDENIALDRDAVCQQLMAIVDETELKYGPDCGDFVLLDACLEIASGHSRDIVHMMVDATYDRLEDKPRKPSPRAH
jgi:hypothetical protein